MRRLPLCLIVAWATLGGWVLPTPSFAQARTTEQTTEEEQDWQGLPPGRGREETFYMCVPCHSLKLVTQQGLSASRWNEAIDWMVEEQEMAPLDPEDRKLIVDYLAKFYGEDRKSRMGSKR